MKSKWLYRGIAAALMVLMVYAVLMVLLDMWEEESAGNTAEERTVTMLIRESNDTLGLDRMIKKLYVEEKIRVDLQVVPDNQLDSIVRMKVNSGETPDILDSDVPSAYGLINPEIYLEDLSDSEWVDRLKSTEYVAYSDGNIYAFPLQESSGLGGVIYNKTIFDELGIDIPTTEEAFYEVCQILLEADVTPILMSSEVSIPQMWIEYGMSLALGSSENCMEAWQSIELQVNQLTDYPEIIETMDSYLRLFEYGYVNDDFETISYSELCERLGDGMGAMMVGNYNHVSDIEYLNQDTELGMFPIPFDYNVDNEYITTETSKGFVIFKDGDNTDAAKEVLEFWSKPEYLELWFMDFAGISAFEDVENGPMDEELLELYMTYIQEEKEINEFTIYAQSLYDLITTKFWLYYIEAPINGESGWDIAEKCQIDITEYLK